MANAAFYSSGGVATGSTSLTIPGTNTQTTYGMQLVFVYHRSTTAPATPTNTFGALTRLCDLPSAGGCLSIFFRTQVGTGSTTGSATVSGLTSPGIGGMVWINNVNQSYPFALTSALVNRKSSANAEGTYSIASTGASFDAGAGDLAISLIALDNDANIQTYTINGNAATDMGQNFTTTGSDGGAGWAYYDPSVDTTFNAAAFTITEQSTGTANNICALLVVQGTNVPRAPTSAPTVAANTGYVAVTTPATLVRGASSYAVYRGTTLVQNAVAPDTTINDSNAAVISTQTYTVRGTNEYGTSTDGPASSAVAANPNAPTFTLAAGTDRIGVGIQGNAYAATYKVYRGPAGGSLSLVHTSASQSANARYLWEDTTVTPGTSYDYSVTTTVTTPTTRESPQATPVTGETIATLSTVQSTFENGTDEVQPATSDTPASGDTALGYVVDSNYGSIVYDTARAAHGATSVRIDLNALSYAQEALGLSKPEGGYVYSRGYFYFASNPSDPVNIMVPRGAAGPTPIEVSASGKIQVGSTVTTASIPLNQWFRIEAQWILGSAGVVTARLYSTADSTSITESFTATGLNYPSITDVMFGSYHTVRTGGFQYFVDDISVSNEGWIGPVAASGTAWTSTPSDVLGLTDSSWVLDVSPDRSDSLGLTYSRALDISLDRSDALGLTDVVVSELDRSDSLGLTDAVTRRALDTGLDRQDALGITDAVARRPIDVALDRSDSLGLTDAVARRALDTTIDRSDALGLTDIVTRRPIDTSLDRSDALGLTDTRVLDGSPDRQDGLGLTDSRALDGGLDRSDPFGLTDSQVLDASLDRTDAFGLTDAVAAQVIGLEATLDITDSVGLVDTVLAPQWVPRDSGDFVVDGMDIDAVAYGNGVWVAVGLEGHVAKSSDGITWENVVSFTTADFNDIAFGNGVFIAVDSGGRAWESSNGTDWTPWVINGGGGALWSIAFGFNMFTVGGVNFTATFVRPGQGVTTATPAIGTVYALAYGNGVWVAVGPSGAVATSTNGTAWTPRTSNFGASTVWGVTYGANTFVIVGASGKIATSADGQAWALQTGVHGISTIYDVTFGSGRFIAVGSSGKISTSIDGANWTADVSGYLSGSFLDVAFGGTQWVAVGSLGILATKFVGPTFSDTLGYTDSRVLTVDASRTDSAGPTDPAGRRVAEATRDLSDSSGLSDTFATDFIAGGTDWTATPSDTLGLTDATASDVSSDRSDSLGLADSLGLGYGRDLSDTLGLTDARVLDAGPDRTDNAGLTDSQTYVRFLTLDRSDNLGMTDSRALDAGLSRQDSEGLTDSSATAPLLQRSYQDSLGHTDSRDLAVVTDDGDPLGITDSEYETPTTDTQDPVGLVDTRGLTIVVDRSDSLGVTDVLTVVRNLSIDVTDPMVSGAKTDYTLHGTTDLSSNGWVRDNDTASLVVGVEFEATEANCFFAGYRIYIDDAMTAQARLYHLTGTGSTGEVVADTDVTGWSIGNNSFGQWYETRLTQPVDLIQGDNYRVAIYLPGSHYFAFSHYWDGAGGAGSVPATSGITSGPLHGLGSSEAAWGVQGSYSYGSGLAFPDSEFNHADYGVDLVLQQGVGGVESIAFDLFRSVDASDTLGLTDTEAASTDGPRLDGLSLTDSSVNALAIARSYSDILGLTDAGPVEVLPTRVDNAGLTDSVTYLLGHSLDTTDVLDLTDNRALVATQDVQDALGFLDNEDGQPGPEQVNTENLSDTRLIDASASRQDSLGLTDAWQIDLSQDYVDLIMAGASRLSTGEVFSPAQLETFNAYANTNLSTHTSLSVPLQSTTVGHLNVVEISGYATGTLVNPGMTTPDGWTKHGEQMDTNGTPASWVGVYSRTFQEGDSSSVAFNWTNPGQMVAISTAWIDFDPTTPIPWITFQFKSASDTNYAVSGTVGSDGVLTYGFACRSGNPNSGTPSWNTLSDSARGMISNPSAATMVGRYADQVTAGTAFTKTAVGTAATSVGVMWAYSVAGTMVGSRAVDDWISDTPLYVAHRGGSVDWPAMTIFAYDHAVAVGATALEVSTWRSSDGVWVASHDQSTLAMTGVDLDIPTTPWATLSALRTTVGNLPLATLTEVLTKYGQKKIIFIEDKGPVGYLTEFLDLLDSFPNANSQFVIKGFVSSSSGTQGKLRGYRTWGYYYEADVPDLAATQDRWTLLGMDHAAPQAAWDAILAYGKPVLGHVTQSTTHVATAFSKGAVGVMTGKVVGVIPSPRDDTYSLAVDKAVTDANNPTDVSPASLDLSRSDDLGLTDSATYYLDAGQTFTDDLGLTDSTQVVNSVVSTTTDQLGLSDSAATFVARGYDASDALALSDQAALAVDQDTSNSLGLTDLSATSASGSGSAQDLASITDQFAVELVGDRAEQLGLTDASGVMLALDRSDSLGVNDSLGSDTSLDRQDTATLSDATAKDLDAVARDTLGLTDTRALTISGSFTNSLAIQDSIQKTASKDFTDLIQIHDRNQGSGVPWWSFDYGRDRQDSLELADLGASSVDLARSDGSQLTDAYVNESDSNPTDRLGLSDSLTTDIRSEWTDDVGLVDAVSIFGLGAQSSQDLFSLTDDFSVDLTTEQQDALGLTDTRIPELGLTYADSLGLTDSVAAPLAFGRDYTDSLGLQDAISIDLSRSDTANLTDVLTSTLLADRRDDLGLTDSVASVVELDTTDISGLTDTRPWGSTWPPVWESLAELDVRLDRAEDVGLSDAIDAGTLGTSNVTDLLSLTDSVETASVTVVDLSDSLGLSDAVASDIQMDVQDPLGLSDYALVSSSGGLATQDQLGLVDTVEFSVESFAGDALGLTEVIDVTPGLGRVDSLSLGDVVSTDVGIGSTDALGLTDVVAATREGGTDFTDNTGLTDDQTRRLVISGDTTNVLGLTDSVVVERVLTAGFTDQFGLTDTVSLASDIRLDVRDSLGVTDSRALTRSLSASDSLGLTDLIQVVAPVRATDDLGLTDSVGTELSRQGEKDLNEGLALTDSTTLAVGVPARDQVQLSDSFSVVLARGLDVRDVLGVTDSQQRDLAASRTDRLGITDRSDLDTRPELTDDAGLTDEFQYVLLVTRSYSDDTGLAETSETTRELVRAYVDGATLSDAVSFLGSLDLTSELVLTDSLRAFQVQPDVEIIAVLYVTGPRFNTVVATPENRVFLVKGPVVDNMRATVDGTDVSATGPEQDLTVKQVT